MDDWKNFKVSPGSFLNEYIPLFFPEVSITLGEMEHGSYGLGYSSLQWCLKEDVEKDDSYRQIFSSDQELEFLGYSNFFQQDVEVEEGKFRHLAIDLAEGERFRLPDFNYVFGTKSIIVSQRMYGTLEFSPKMATTRGNAILHDPFHGVHKGYHYISFLNPLFLPRAEKRFRDVAASQRPFIFVRLSDVSEMLFVRKELLEEWQKKGFTGYLQEYNEKYLDLNAIDEWDDIYFKIDYDSLRDWQNDKYRVHYY